MAKSTYWEDRLTSAQCDKISAALAKFDKSNGNRTAQDIAYDEMTNAGMTSEEADEMLNICID